MEEKMTNDKAIEAAAEALHPYLNETGLDLNPEPAARIAIEAAAPHMTAPSYFAYQDVKQRAERAEVLADQLAEALRTVLGSHIADALAAYEESRRKND